MPKIPLIVAPSWSRATRFTLKAARHLNWWFLKRLTPTRFLRGPQVRRDSFWRTTHVVRVLEQPPHLLAYFGHGEEDGLVGLEPLGYTLGRYLLRCEDAPWIQDFLVVSIACKVGQELADCALDAGVRGWLGASENMWVDFDFTDTDLDGLNDLVEVFTAPTKRLALGGTLQEAYEEFSRQTAYFVTLYGAKPGAEDLVETLQENQRVLHVYGDPQARWVPAGGTVGARSVPAVELETPPRRRLLPAVAGGALLGGVAGGPLGLFLGAGAGAAIGLRRA